MVSVLIPLYNEEISDLIGKLLMSIDVADTQAEIIISDVSEEAKYSPDPDNNNHIEIRYFRHDKILSRSENRNFLASCAKYPWLIFMDCDAVVPDSSFIQKYLECTQHEHVVCGGTSYQENRPSDKKRRLRWKYGRQREQTEAAKRNLNPYGSFSSFNFCIPASIFAKLGFNEGIKNYGHEDTYFGYQLKKLGQPILHIDNPLIHNGLDSSDDFIFKTEVGIQSLVQISQSGAIPADFLSSIRLWKTYQQMRKRNLQVFLRVLAPILMSLIRVNLLSSNPDIRLFDLYKLLYLAKIQG